MPRPPRIKFENAWYHVMNRGAGRKAVFKSDEQRLLFLGLLKELRDRYDIEVHAYCLMGNHFHLLLRTPEPTLSEGLKHLSSAYTKKFNRLEKIDGPLFRSRFKSVLIDAYDYLVEVSRYIHRNPVEAKLVEELASYNWSSYRAYLGLDEQPEWLSTSEILARVSALDDRSAYGRLVENKSLPTLKSFYNSNRLPGVLGSSAFKHYVSGLGFPNARDPFEAHYSVGHVVDVVSQTLGESKASITVGTKGRRSPLARSVALSIAEQNCGVTRAELATHFNLSERGLAVALFRLRQTEKKHPTLLATTIKHVETMLKAT